MNSPQRGHAAQGAGERVAGFVARCLALFLVAGLLAACSDAFDLKRNDESVVRVQHMFDYKGKQILGGHGTGFVLNDEGYVITNYHVVDVSEKLPPGLKPLYIFIPDGSWEKRLKADVVWVSKANDLAILRVPGLQRRPVTLARVAPNISPEKGETVFALGFPGAGDSTGRKAALESSFTQGNVSKVSLGRGQRGGAERQIIQHTANINPGNSGGPLFNGCNQVIGINTFAAKSILKIEKNSDGDFVAHGAAVTGVSYSPHIATLIEQLRTVPELRNIKYNWSSDVCVARSGTPVEMYVAIVLISILALASMILALVRRRGSQEVIRVVETYSQWVRRKGGENASGPSTGRRRGIRRRSSAAPEVAPADLDDGWLLSGFDAAGNKVRLLIGKEELAYASKEADNGLIIGRSHALATKILADTSVSRRHARIVAMEGGIGIEDLNSTYGTSVNGKRLEPYNAVALPAGAKLTIGDVELEVSAR